MIFGEWQENYLVNIDEIDAHHQQLLRLLNKLYQDIFACNNTSEQQVLIEQLLTDLISYTDYHFEAEERLLLQYDYPDYEYHKKQHDEFKLKLNQLMEQHKNGTLVWSFPIFLFLKDWICVHILHSDQQYAPYLKKYIK